MKGSRLFMVDYPIGVFLPLLLKLFPSVIHMYIEHGYNLYAGGKIIEIFSGPMCPLKLLSRAAKKEANAFVWRVLFALSAKTRLNKSQSLLYIPTFGGVAFQCWILECDMGDNSYQAWTKGSHLRAVKEKKKPHNFDDFV